MTLSFFVPGQAVPQAALRAFIIQDKITGRHRPILTNSSKGLSTWRATVAMTAQEAKARAHHPGWFGREAVTLTLRFLFPRPASHPKRSPPQHVVRPDLDHLIRGLSDGCTGVLFTDDSQIVELMATKGYLALGESPGVSVTVAQAIT